MNTIRRSRSLQGAILSTLFLTAVPATVNADRPGNEKFQERIPVPAENWSDEEAKASEWLFGVAPGATVFMFDEESGGEVFGALYAEVSHSSVPLNFRTGVEFGGFESDQDSVISAAGIQDADVGFIRVPLSVEYVLPVTESAKLFLGGGGDFIRVDDVPSDNVVGVHASARAQYNFTDLLGLSVEGGYLWAEADLDDHGDFELDGPYISTLLTFNF